MSALDDLLYEALRPDIDARARLALLTRATVVMGWGWGFWPSWVPAWISRFSMTIAPTRRIFISTSLIVGSPAACLPALIHELAHARRAELLGRFAWFFSYFASPSFRRAEEIEADAWALAMRAALRGVADPSADDFLVEHALEQAAQWSGWAAPYFCGGDVEDGAEAVLERAGEILARAEVGDGVG